MAGKKTSAAAMIEIRPCVVRMDIAQVQRNQLHILDTLEHPLDLDHDIYYHSEVRCSRAWTLSRILNSFSEALLSYGVKDTEAVISSAVGRSIANLAMLQEQMKNRAHLHTYAIDENEEKALIFHDSLIQLSQSGFADDPALLVYADAYTTCIAVYQNHTITHYQSIPTGSLCVLDHFDHSRHIRPDLKKTIMEYIQVKLSILKLPELVFTQILFIGPSIDVIAQELNCEHTGTVYHQSADALLSRFAPPNDPALPDFHRDAAVHQTELLIFHTILQQVPKVKQLRFIQSGITLALLRRHFFSKTQDICQKLIHTSALSCAEHITKPTPHGHLVRKTALAVYTRMKKLHGITQPDARLYLELATIFYDHHPFISYTHHAEIIYHLIRGLELPGITQEALQIIALTAAGCQKDPFHETARYYASAGNTNAVLARKLSAILGLAAALDASKTGKLKNIKLSLSENRLIVSATSLSTVPMEIWAFRSQADAFSSVFGVNPELQITTALLS